MFYYDLTPTPYYTILVSFSHSRNMAAILTHQVAHPTSVCLPIGAVATLFIGILLLKEVVEGDLPSLYDVVNLSYDRWHVLLLLLVNVADNPRFIRIYKD